MEERTSCLREFQVENSTQGSWRAFRTLALNLTQISRFRANVNLTRKLLRSCLARAICSLSYHPTELLVGLYCAPNSFFFTTQSAVSCLFPHRQEHPEGQDPALGSSWNSISLSGTELNGPWEMEITWQSLKS